MPQPRTVDLRSKLQHQIAFTPPSSLPSNSCDVSDDQHAPRAPDARAASLEGHVEAADSVHAIGRAVSSNCGTVRSEDIPPRSASIGTLGEESCVGSNALYASEHSSTGSEVLSEHASDAHARQPIGEGASRPASARYSYDGSARHAHLYPAPPVPFCGKLTSGWTLHSERSVGNAHAMQSNVDVDVDSLGLSTALEQWLTPLLLHPLSWAVMDNEEGLEREGEKAREAHALLKRLADNGDIHPDVVSCSEQQQARGGEGSPIAMISQADADGLTLAQFAILLCDLGELVRPHAFCT